LYLATVIDIAARIELAYDNALAGAFFATLI
jgi:hypothetical protein